MRQEGADGLLYFFLDERKIHHRGNKLKGNPRIIKFNPAMFWRQGLPTPNPSYPTLDELTRLDKRFKEFKKERHSTAKIIVLEKHIQVMKDMILSRATDNSHVGNMLLHLVEGSRTAKKFSGIHYLPTPLPDYIINFKEIEPPNHQGVYTASFEILDGGRVLTKEKNSTVFPKEWSWQKLYDECLFALDHKINVESDSPPKKKYKSMTLSRIPVEIYFDENEKRINTLYPIRQ